MTATRTAAQLLQMAELILSGKLRMPHGRGARVAALLARTALEDVVEALCKREGLDVSEASMRVKLACLRTVARSAAGEAAVAWWGLSRACHQHAFEIAPHRAEVAHLVGQVRDLATAEGSVRPPAGDAHRAEPPIRGNRGNRATDRGAGPVGLDTETAR